MEEEIYAFRDVLAQAKRIVVIAGAGLSAASGLETYRGNGGLWEKHAMLKLVTPAGFIDNPSRIWQFHHARRERMFKAVPNPAHIALARLALPDFRHKLAPNAAAFTLITQNIDGLDRRAVNQIYADAGLPSPFTEAVDPEPVLIEMHGHIAGIRCMNYECRHRGMNFDSPICPSLAGKELWLDGTEEKGAMQGDPASSESVPRRPKRTAAEARAWAEARLSGAAEQNSENDGIPVSELPRCPKCGGLLRPDVVWFTEVPPRAEEVVQIVEKADLCLVVGTSAVVHPAATFATKVKEHGGKVAIFNIEEGKRDSVADFVFLGPCEEILPRVLAPPDGDA